MKILINIVFTLFFATTAMAQEIVLATTTSVENSGLLSYILPVFEKKKQELRLKLLQEGLVQQLRWGKSGTHVKELQMW